MVKKRVLFLTWIIILISFKIFSQTKVENLIQTQNEISFDLSLLPLKYTIEKDNYQQNVISFSGYMDEAKPGNYYLPTRIIFVELPSVSSIQISSSITNYQKIQGVPSINPLVTAVNDSLLVYQNYNRPVSLEKNASTSAVELAGFTWIRDYYCAVLKIHQYQYNNSDFIQQINNIHLTLKINKPGNFIPLKSNEKDFYEASAAKMILNYDPSLRMDKAKFFTGEYDSLTSWINYSNTYLKMGVNRDGVYRITPSDLSSFGISSSIIDPATFKIFLRGKEIPIYVHYQDNSNPASWDYIEFFGFRNWGSPDYKKVNAFNTPYNEYLNRYSDTTIYWLTWSGTPGLRIDTILNTNGIPNDTINYYTEVAHYEQNQWLDYSVADLARRQDPDWIENETWVWGQQYVGTNNYPFTISDLVAGKTADAYYKIQDYASDITNKAHKIGLSINTDPTIYDSEYINKYEQKVLHAVFPTSSIKNGSNILHAISYPTAATINSIEYDWYEIDYPRYLNAINDSLEFQITDTINSQPAQIMITNLTSSTYSLYKISGRLKKITNFNLSNGVLTFNDSVFPGSKYYLITTTKITKPNFYYKKNFVDIASSSNQADYILITYPSFISESQKYADYISQQFNVTTKVINVFDIYDEFNYGFFAPEPIKYFLQSAFNNWEFPKPAYLFLIGDADYDYYGNKVKYFNSPPAPNYVPSYGDCVSDVWYVVWDTTGTLIPQMYVGRLPANSNADIEKYLQRLQNYESAPYDIWNKRYFFISGGDSQNPSEISQLNDVNNQIINNTVEPAPVGGIIDHFYKTTNPITNLGPYTQDQIATMIDSGAVFFSYIGHSGTQIWDNGINDPSQLQNAVNRFSLITDFGCSTGKFAEPDIKSFSELFTVGPNSNAIAYIGNSSLGFFSTTLVYPQMFYQILLSDSLPTLGETHMEAKVRLLQNYGTSEVYRVFDLCNTLIGDPIIKIKIPPLPNLVVAPNDINYDQNNLNGSNDSLQVKVNYYNYGRVDTSTFNILITHYYNGNIIETKEFAEHIPLISDSLIFYIKTKNLVGLHKIDVKIDPENKINELSKTDNEASVQFNVASNTVRALVLNSNENISNGQFVILNPADVISSDSLNVLVANNSNFSDSENYYYKYGIFQTQIKIPGLVTGTRYWIKFRTANAGLDYSIPISFVYDESASGSNFFINDSIGFSNTEIKNLSYSANGISLSRYSKLLKVVSAGYYDGDYATISVNNVDYLPNGNLEGTHIAVFDSSLNFQKSYLFDYWANTATFESNITAFLDTVSSNEILAFANSGGGGSGFTTKVKNAIKQFGSKYIDQMNFRYNWAMIGRKGAVIGTVPEVLSPPYQGPVTVDTTIIINNTNGYFVTGKIGPVNKWDTLSIKLSNNNYNDVNVNPIIFNSSGIADTLVNLNGTSGNYNLTNLQGGSAKFMISLNKGSSSDSAAVQSLLIKYQTLPELGTNGQAVSLSSDSVKLGNDEKLNFTVFNAGGSEADSFKVDVDLNLPDKSQKVVYDTLIVRLAAGNSIPIFYNYKSNVNDGYGKMSFTINIDPNQKINEIYKDNNIYNVPFSVYVDSVTLVRTATISYTFDGNLIYNGDYVSPNPDISFNLKYGFQYPYRDTTDLNFILDGNRIAYSSMDSIVYDTINRQVTFKIREHLADGEHTLIITGTNLTNESQDLQRTFYVSNEMQILDVYNYPDPFASSTYFTFNLTNIPDELKIKIFTVAGRLIKVINVPTSNLKNNFNRIYWDGRD